MASDRNLRFAQFSRRTFLLICGKIALGCMLLGRLFYLQIFRSGELSTLAEENRIKIAVVPPPRGIIIDRNGVPLATNQNYYRVQLYREKTNDVKKVILLLGRILNLSEDRVQEILQKAYKARRGNPVILHEYLSWQEVANIEGNASELPGISIAIAQSRYYPLGSFAAHITGYISPILPEEITERHPLYFHPDYRIGRNGIEKTCNAVLQGKPGMRRLEVNAFGETVDELSSMEAEIGKTQKVTIHAKLQEELHQHLPELGAAVVVLDVRTGDILSLASTPSYDPNRFSQKLSSEYWKALNQSPFHPLVNKAISTPYPPASTFKVIVALAALSEGISPHTRIECTGGVFLGNHVFRCLKHDGHGYLDLHRALMVSCNVYFYTLARRIGNEKIMQMAEMLGLGQSYDIKLPGERAGLLPTKKWKRAVLKQEWTAGDTLNSGIGQGYVLATPLQLAVVAGRIASGKKIIPRLLLPENEVKPPVFEDLNIAPEHLATVRAAMASVVNEIGGTAYYRSRINSPTMSMAGKTGTAQVVSKRTKMRIADHWSNHNHGLFISFGPVGSPRYACSVVAEHGGGGGIAAAPLAKRAFMILDEIENPDRPTVTEEAVAATIVPPAPDSNQAEKPQTSLQNEEEFEQFYESDEEWVD